MILLLLRERIDKERRNAVPHGALADARENEKACSAAGRRLGWSRVVLVVLDADGER